MMEPTEQTHSSEGRIKTPEWINRKNLFRHNLNVTRSGDTILAGIAQSILRR